MDPNIWRLNMMYLTKTYLLMIVSAVCLTMTQPAWAGVEMGQVPNTVDLNGNLGGRLDGSPWSSNELNGKVSVIFYVDPDEKDLNNEASDALQKEKFPLDNYQSFAIINMDASWLPNFAISSALKEKQERYPTAIYVRDYDKVLVKGWDIADDNSDVLAFDKQGKLIFMKYGKLSDSDIKNLIEVIRAHIDK